MATDQRAGDGRSGVRLRFAGGDLSPSAVRSFLSGVLAEWGVEVGADRDTMLLLASELATNAVEHTAAGFTVSIRSDDGLLRVDVYDTEPMLPALRHPTGFEGEGGRGLILVDRLASAWGAHAVEGGKVVWFELALGSP